jgi:hypothetical protein
MRKIVPVLGATTLIGFVASVHLWQELSESRRNARDLQDQLAALQVGQTRPLLPTGIGFERGEPQPLPASDAVADAAQMPTAQSAPGSAANNGRSVVISAMELANDPVTRQAMAAGIRATLPLRYPFLAEELNLTEEQTRKLHDQLVENQLEMLAVGPPAGADADARRQAASRAEELARSHDAALASMLGATTFGQWKDYQETQGVHVQMGQLDTVLKSTAQPLSAVQRSQMTAALASHQKQVNLATPRASQATASGSTGDGDAKLEELLQAEERQNQMMRDVAASYLSREQLDELEKMHSRAAALTRDMLGRQRPAGTD